MDTKIAENDNIPFVNRNGRVLTNIQLYFIMPFFIFIFAIKYDKLWPIYPFP